MVEDPTGQHPNTTMDVENEPLEDDAPVEKKEKQEFRWFASFKKFMVRDPRGTNIKLRLAWDIPLGGSKLFFAIKTPSQVIDSPDWISSRADFNCLYHTASIQLSHNLFRWI